MSALRKKKKVKKTGHVNGTSGPGSSDVTASSETALGELVNSFAEHLDFSPPAAAGGREQVSELSELRTSLRQLSQRLGSLRTGVTSLSERLGCEQQRGSNNLPTGSAAYVDMKVQMMLSYILSLVYYLLLKTRGTPVRDHAVTLRLMWLRTLLEKLKPVDQRLQYQMNKLLQAAEAEASAGDGANANPHALRPGQLATTVEDEESGEEAEEAEPQNYQEDDGIYRPPRISQVEYTGDHVTAKERAEREYDRQKRRFESSDMVRSLRQEFTDAPAEIRGEQRSAAAEKAQRKMAEQMEYEEENMVRLRMSKTEKKEQQRLFRTKRGQSGGAVSLEDLSSMNDIAAALEGGGKGGKSKGKGRKGGSALQNFQGAAKRLRDATSLVDSVAGGHMPDGLGSFKRGRGGGGKGGDKGGGKGKRQKR